MLSYVHCRGSSAALDGGVLGGQAEGVPADRVHDVEAALHPVAGEHVAERVRLGVTHVQVAGGVREHVEHVLLGPLVVGPPAAERRELVPHRQPARLDRVRVVPLLHRSLLDLGHRLSQLIGRACRSSGSRHGRTPHAGGVSRAGPGRRPSRSARPGKEQLAAHDTSLSQRRGGQPDGSGHQPADGGVRGASPSAGRRGCTAPAACIRHAPTLAQPAAGPPRGGGRRTSERGERPRDTPEVQGRSAVGALPRWRGVTVGRPERATGRSGARLRRSAQPRPLVRRHRRTTSERWALRWIRWGV